MPSDTAVPTIVSPPEYAPLPIKSPRASVTKRPDGSILIEQNFEMPEPWPSIPALLIARTAAHPDRDLLAWRRQEANGTAGSWDTLSYGAATDGARRLATAFLRHGLKRDDCIMVLSGPGPGHLLVNLGAQFAGIPYAPISPNFSLLGDFARLKHVVDICQPKLIFADDPALYGDAVAAIASLDMLLVTSAPGGAEGWITLESLLAHEADSDLVDAVLAAIKPDDHAKTIFTSGSTGRPKAVIQTQRMLTGIIRQHDALYEKVPEEAPPSYLSWLTWSHVGSNNVTMGDVLNDGATFYIDNGRPVAGQFDQTIRNLKEIRPVEYGSAPVFFAHLAAAMEGDAQLRDAFFSRLRCLYYATAGLSQDVFERIQRLAVEATGRRIPIISKYGTTETQGTLLTQWPIDHIGPLGLPFPGVTIKLAPVGERYEIRVKGETVTPGYFRDPEATAAAFDEEGFYCTGDAAVLTDPADPTNGISFDGRVSENFKLGSGTWVSVGSLRIDLIRALAPIVHDAVITGENRDDLGALIWLRPIETAALTASAGPDGVAEHLLAGLRAHNAQAGGSSRRIRRLLVLDAPPYGDEVADKGYINQREVLRRRHKDVERLYADQSASVLIS